MKTNQPSHITRAAALPLIVAFGLVSGISRADLVVNYDSPLVPPELQPGDSFHLVFVTSASYNRLSAQLSSAAPHFDES